MTWIVNLEDGKTKLEIGRIRNLVTVGKLVVEEEGGKEKDGEEEDAEDCWEVVFGFDISPTTGNAGNEETESVGGGGDGGGGTWQPNLEESMLSGVNISSASGVDKLAIDFLTSIIVQKRYETGKGIKHEFFIESEKLLGMMDPFGDGIAMDPRWLYEGLDLGRCTACGCLEQTQKKLSRCGRCGTAAYCSGVCQKRDWAVHKAVCGMDTETRGKALYLSSKGGVVGWEPDDDEEEEEDGEDGEEDDGDEDEHENEDDGEGEKE